MAEALDLYRTGKAREDLVARLPISDARELRAAATYERAAAYNPSGRPSVGFQFEEEELRTLVEVYFPERWHDWAMRVSKCESNWLTNAKNPRSSAAGLFQFLRSTWDWVASETGTPSYDEGGVWEVHHQLVNAAWLVDPKNGGPSHWVCK